MSELKPGIYETVLTEDLYRKLERISSDLGHQREDLTSVDIADRLARHIGEVTRRAIDSLPEDERVEAALKLTEALLKTVGTQVQDFEPAADTPRPPGSLLQSIAPVLPDGTQQTLKRPLIPLLDTTLLTNAPGEPRVGSQILEEIDTADRIDLIMAFIRRSGINPLEETLKRHCQAGKELRVLTTTFTGTTELKALERLQALGAKVKVSYDQSINRLHAKAWLFHRESGFTTAYIGSSNLTTAGQIRGLEWNVRVSGSQNHDVVTKFESVFESYWNLPDFLPFNSGQFAERSHQTQKTITTLISSLDIRLEPFQERLLEQVEVSRKKGLHRNLLVSATGTGKTVMAAVDYARLAVKLKRARLLFVAHREEILEQSLVLFRQAMKDPAFGELWVGANRPSRFEHVFASIQSLKSTGLGELNPDHFDVVIVDEFHHAAAPSYQSLLTRLRPVELLGLTATPERSDGLPILDHFDHRIAAELRLWDAIDQHYLVPFDYYGINDGLDLRSIPWRRGRGYDVEALTHVLTSNDVWARTVVQQTIRRADPETMSALAFCVSVDHARYMARVFREAGLAAEAIWADTPETERKASLKRLAKGETKIIFSVDLFNEGVDVPAVDTLLLLRPTDSPVLFLQQLGRGLRRRPGKERCLVLDFVGQHRQEFRFDRRLRALLGGSLSQLRLQIERGFPFLPAGCNMELDAVAKERILENLKNSIPTRWNEKVAELKTLVKTRGRVTLREFLKETELELSDLYQGNRGWSDLLEAAQVECSPSGPHEKELRRACGRLLHIDDPERIRAYRDFLTQTNAPKCSSMSERDRRLFRMLVASVTERAIEGSTSLDEAASLLWAHSQVVRELLELLDGLEEKISHVVSPLQRMPDVPLHVHARYTRIEILAAFGCGERARVMRWQTGVHWSKEAKADLFAFTLDKTSGLFSPTTRYRDYAISPELIHWESQSVTRADSETGLRYQNHQKMGTSVMLFARPDTNDRAFWFLGPGNYQKHVSERPMAITWKLDRQLPGDIYAVMAAAIA